MNKTLGKIAIGASMAIGMGALAANPAQAGTLTGATIGGTAAGDYLVYGVSGSNTVVVPNSPASVQAVLSGNAASPTGNVELRASSEAGGFDFGRNTTLSGQIGGKDITLSSLTFDDWFSTAPGVTNLFYGANNLANRWFNDFWAATGRPTNFPLKPLIFSVFRNIGGFERTSDPNISYVNQDDTTGLISIGLAGHFDLKAAYSQPNSPFNFLAQFLPNGFQASEVVKYTYNGTTDFLYSFSATNSGLTEKSDGISHSGNYEVTIDGVPPTKTPEPSVILGMLGVAGVVAGQRKLKKAAA